MEADVTDFSMSSTFTFALADLLNSLDLNDVDGLDDLKDSMDDLTDAATKLVDGSKELSDGASTLDEKVVSAHCQVVRQHLAVAYLLIHQARILWQVV